MQNASGLCLCVMMTDVGQFQKDCFDFLGWGFLLVIYSLLPLLTFYVVFLSGVGEAPQAFLILHLRLRTHEPGSRTVATMDRVRTCMMHLDCDYV